MVSFFRKVSVILSAAKDPQLRAAPLEARILRSFLPQDDNDLAKRVNGFLMQDWKQTDPWL